MILSDRKLNSILFKKIAGWITLLEEGIYNELDANDKSYSFEVLCAKALYNAAIAKNNIVPQNSVNNELTTLRNRSKSMAGELRKFER